MLGPGLPGKLDKRALGCSLDCLTGDGSLRPPDFLITGHVPSSVCTQPDVDLQLADPRGELVEGWHHSNTAPGDTHCRNATVVFDWLLLTEADNLYSFLCYSRCSEGSDTEPYITPAGFQFLLLDTASQIWFFMLQYLETVQARLILCPFGIWTNEDAWLFFEGLLINQPIGQISCLYDATYVKFSDALPTNRLAGKAKPFSPTWTVYN